MVALYVKIVHIDSLKMQQAGVFSIDESIETLIEKIEELEKPDIL